MLWWIVGGYAFGAIVTLILNRMVIAGPVTSPLAVLRNAIVWPVMLPVIIYAAFKR